MVTASLIATLHRAENPEESFKDSDEEEEEAYYDSVDGPSEEEVYLQGIIMLFYTYDFNES